MILEGRKGRIGRWVHGRESRWWVGGRIKYERLNIGILNGGVGWKGCGGNDVNPLRGWRKCKGWVQEGLNWGGFSVWPVEIWSSLSWVS